MNHLGPCPQSGQCDAARPCLFPKPSIYLQCLPQCGVITRLCPRTWHGLVVIMSSPPGDIDPSLLPHDTAGPRLNTSVWVLFSLSSIFLSLRVYCKYLGRRGLWWDDWILIVSWVSNGSLTS